MNVVLGMAASQVWIHQLVVSPRTPDLTLGLPAHSIFASGYNGIQGEKFIFITKAHMHDCSVQCSAVFADLYFWWKDREQGMIIFVFQVEWANSRVCSFLVYDRAWQLKGGSVLIFTNFRLSEFLTLVSLSTTFFLFLHTRDLNLQLSEVRWVYFWKINISLTRHFPGERQALRGPGPGGSGGALSQSRSQHGGGGRGRGVWWGGGDRGLWSGGCSHRVYRRAFGLTCLQGIRFIRLSGD